MEIRHINWRIDSIINREAKDRVVRRRIKQGELESDEICRCGHGGFRQKHNVKKVLGAGQRMERSCKNKDSKKCHRSDSRGVIEF
jgi:hypothetical protein